MSHYLCHLLIHYITKMNSYFSSWIFLYFLSIPSGFLHCCHLLLALLFSSISSQCLFFWKIITNSLCLNLWYVIRDWLFWDSEGDGEHDLMEWLVEEDKVIRLVMPSSVSSIVSNLLFYLSALDYIFLLLYFRLMSWLLRNQTINQFIIFASNIY